MKVPVVITLMRYGAMWAFMATILSYTGNQPALWLVGIYAGASTIATIDPQKVREFFEFIAVSDKYYVTPSGIRLSSDDSWSNYNIAIPLIMIPPLYFIHYSLDGGSIFVTVCLMLVMALTATTYYSRLTEALVAHNKLIFLNAIDLVLIGVSVVTVTLLADTDWLVDIGLVCFVAVIGRTFLMQCYCEDDVCELINKEG